MENYKTTVVNPMNSEYIDIATGIPLDIVKGIEASIKELPYHTTPIMIDPIDSTVTFGIMEKLPDGKLLKYKVSISEVGHTS